MDNIQYLVRDPKTTPNACHPKNVITKSGIVVLWDPHRLGYILQGFGKRRFDKKTAVEFAQKLESKYGKDSGNKA